MHGSQPPSPDKYYVVTRYRIGDFPSSNPVKRKSFSALHSLLTAVAACLRIPSWRHSHWRWSGFFVSPTRFTLLCIGCFYHQLRNSRVPSGLPSALRKRESRKIDSLLTKDNRYQFWHDVVRRGQYIWIVQDMHAKYGPIIRINPYELHISDSAFYESLYATGGIGIKRDKWSWDTVSFPQ
jgi:hypothetical protein